MLVCAPDLVKGRKCQWLITSVQLVAHPGTKNPVSVSDSSKIFYRRQAKSRWFETTIFSASEVLVFLSFLESFDLRWIQRDNNRLHANFPSRFCRPRTAIQKRRRISVGEDDDLPNFSYSGSFKLLRRLHIHLEDVAEHLVFLRRFQLSMVGVDFCEQNLSVMLAVAIELHKPATV